MPELNVVKYITTTPILKTLFGNEPLHVKEIGDGNLNFIFRAQTAQKSLILKYSPPYLRMLGKAFKLPQSRICAEMHTMAYFKSIASEFIPTLYHCDEKAFLFVMEDLEGYETLQQKQLHEPISMSIYAKLGDFLALMRTHTPPLMPESYYENNTLKTISENYIFRYPYILNHEALVVPSFLAQSPHSKLFEANIATLTELFLHAKETLVHGDLHTGSIMIKEENLKIIDAEFAFFGPIGFDIGTLFAHILFGEIYAKFAHKPHQSELALSTLWEHFMAHNSNDNILLQTSIGFCGAELLRRLFVPAKAKALETLSVAKKKEAYQLTHSLAVELVESSLHVKHFDIFLAIVKKYL